MPLEIDHFNSQNNKVKAAESSVEVPARVLILSIPPPLIFDSVFSEDIVFNEVLKTFVSL